MQSVIIGPNQAGQRLDKFLRKYLPQAGTGFLYKMLRKKNITLNGKKADGCELLTLNDQVQFYFSPETFSKLTGHSAQPETAFSYKEYRNAYHILKGIRVVHEDMHILILDKPAGVLTQKADSGDLSLNEWMIGYLLATDPEFERELISGFHPSVCNRLDRNTAGLVLCGKSLKGLQYLSRCIRERSIRKFYRTICLGRLQEASRIEGYLVKDHAKNKVRLTDEKSPGADESYIETAYSPLKTGAQYTLLEVELITGKPHQIRAHLAGIGHPLIGDFKYGDLEKNEFLKEEYGLRHQLLWAFQVIFPEDALPGGEAVAGRRFTGACPELFRRLQTELGLL